jgi:hypothetical protein
VAHQPSQGWVDSPRSLQLAGIEPGGRDNQEAAAENIKELAAPRGFKWDFSKIPIFPPDRASRPQASSAVAARSLPGIIQPKLAVGPVDDPLEREADRVADRVMRMPDPGLSVSPVPAHEERDQLQTKPATMPVAASSAAPGTVGEVLRAPGQPLDASTRAFFEPRFGRGLGAVRIHADHSAAAAARSLGAAAFTVGPDIAFAAGRYQPGSSAGQRLLAHELSHVVQQSGGAPGMARAAPVGIQRAVDTLGGEWDTGTYALVNSNGKDIGVTMDRLTFKAKDPVNATKIGLTQKVNSIDNGSPTSLNPTVRQRSIPTGKTDAGSHIDRLAPRSNPIYGMNDPTDAGKTLGGSVTAGNSQWGYHYRLKPQDVVPQHLDATLYDQPTLPTHGPNSSQLFETAALAVEGVQAGTFYGSVRWGWRSDATNKMTIEPLSVVSVGVPSATFKQSSKLWNAGKTSTGAHTVKLPIAAGSTSAMVPSAMTDAQISARLKQITKELLNAPVGQTTETLKFEQHALLEEQSYRQMGDFPMTEKNPNVATG